MRNFAKIAWLICVCAAGVAAQDDKQIIVRKYVEAPRDIVLQTVAFQPDSPVKFENLRFLVSLEGSGGGNSYRLRNVGTKPIRRVSVATTYGTGSTFANNGNILIMPGELMPEPTPTCCVKEEVIPLTNELREKLNLKGEMRSIIVFMVTEVEFMDGSKFTDQARFDKAQEYMFKISDALYEQKQREVKQP